MNPFKLMGFGIFTAVASPAVARADTPITKVVPELSQIHKWNNSNGDTWDPFWADDDNLYSFDCDGRGFGTKGHNLSFNKLSGNSVDTLQGSLVNPMDDYGIKGHKGADGATWKSCGSECIDGVFYGFVARNIYGNESKDPLVRQTSFNSSLIKSTDRGLTWTRTAQENYDAPLWPGGRFGSPGFFHFGQNGGSVTQDEADKYVYAISNNGFWDGGDNFILARVSRVDLPRLQASDWTYFSGGDGARATSWSADIGQAHPVLELPTKCGWTSPTYIPSLGRYLLVSWYVTPTLKKWFNPAEVKYDFYEAADPWGPWTFTNSLSDKFLHNGHMYGPNICSKFQEQVPGGTRVALFTSGCPFEDKPASLYKIWEIPLLVQTTLP